MSNTPEIRFEGFTDAWEQRKLGEIVQITMGQSPDGSTYSEIPSDYILVQGNADLKDGWVTPRIWTTQVTKKCDVGDLIMSVRAPAGAMGKTAYDAVIGRGVCAIKGNDFIYQALVKMDSEGFWKRDSAGSTFESLNSDAIKKAKLLVPSEAEQLKIGTYFSQLDNAITLHQRKSDEFKTLKKYMLQKMFPKNGEKVPEIRFEGFTDAWEQRKLNEVADIVSGGTPSTTVLEYWDGDIDWYAPAELDGFVYAEGSQRKITEEGLKHSSAKMLPANKTVLFTSRAGIGKTAILKRDACTNQGFQSLVLHDDVDTYFIYSLSNDIKDKAEAIASGSTFAEISGKALGKLEISIPTLEEQSKIGEYFANLDNLITLHQRKSDEFRTLKKYMLQKMFPKQ